MTTLGLAMIVKDETNVIGRCLASVREHIDYWTIIDTGSTDDTRMHVQCALDGIPGQLLTDPWFDFGTNKTRLMNAAHNKTDWVLVLDADATLETVGPYPDAEAGYVRYVGGPTEWSQALLLSGRTSWRYTGRIHEYVEPVTAGARTVDAPGWTVRHHGDGHSDSDPQKYEHYAEILLFDAEAGDPRAMFYLAQTYADLGRTDDAVRWYRLRVEAGDGGFPEERWVAQYRLGVLLMDYGELVMAAQMRPHRAEPWLYLAQRAAGELNWAGARACAEHGLSIPYPFEDKLGIERWIYEWGLLAERSCAAWWLGDRTTCRKDSMALLGTPPPVMRDRILANLELCR